MKKISPKEYVVLDLLRAGGEMYGLEMVKADRGLKRGTIYVLLDRMADKELVSSRQELAIGQAGLPRRLYQISGLGSAVLNAHEAYNAAISHEVSLSGVSG